MIVLLLNQTNNAVAKTIGLQSKVRSTANDTVSAVWSVQKLPTRTFSSVVATYTLDNTETVDEASAFPKKFGAMDNYIGVSTMGEWI